MGTYVEVTRRGWLSRIFNSIGGALLGVLLVAVSVWLLWWNEGRAVDRAGSIAAGADAVVSVDAARVDPENDGELVHFSGEMAVDGPATDPDFDLSVDGIRLRRSVEMYQWNESVQTEKEKHLGGSETTKKTYTYSEIWSDDPIDSSRFKKRGYENPEFVFGTKTFDAPGAKVGAFSISGRLVGQYETFRESVPPTQAMADAFRSSRGRHAAPSNGYVYVGDDPTNPRVGDLRIQFHQAPLTSASIMGRQDGSKLTMWRNGDHELEPRLMLGTHDADAMFHRLEDENTRTTWGLRGLGCLLMWIGFVLIFKPLSVVADFIPLIGSIVGFGGVVAAFLLSAVLGLGTISVAWVRHRPLIGIPLLVGSVVFGTLLLRRARRK